MSIKTQSHLPLIIGHRGASRDAPENTLESFSLAFTQRADGIEADFRLTSDGRIICLHDPSTLRTTGQDMDIASTPFSRVAALDAGSWKGARWAGARIPTLAEVLDLVPEDKWFFIELKCGPDSISPLKRLLQESKKSPECVRLLSFNIALIAQLRQQLPQYQSCCLFDYRYNRKQRRWTPSRADVSHALAATGAIGLASADRAIIDQKFVTELRQQGRELHIWTVDRLAAAHNLCQLGVNSITTNRPGWLRTKLSAGGNQP